MISWKNAKSVKNTDADEAGAHAEAGEIWPWDDGARAELKDYNLLDLGI